MTKEEMMRRNNKSSHRVEECICWAATILLLVLLALLLGSCRTRRETTVDYTLTSTEAYQERRAEEHERQMSMRKAESRDTVREASAHTGQIEIERDTAGRPVKIIYEHIFNGIRTQGSSGIDTVFQKQVILLRDSTGSSQKDTLIDGNVKEKQNFGVSPWAVGIGSCVFWLLIAGVAAVVYIRVKKWK